MKRVTVCLLQNGFKKVLIIVKHLHRKMYYQLLKLVLFI